MDPLANPRRLRAMARSMDDARATGARVVTGGERVSASGNFFASTVLIDVFVQSDVFNNEPFGLAGFAFTESIKTVHAMSHELEVGRLCINQPAAPRRKCRPAMSRIQPTARKAAQKPWRLIWSRRPCRF